MSKLHEQKPLLGAGEIQQVEIAQHPKGTVTINVCSASDLKQQIKKYSKVSCLLLS